MATTDRRVHDSFNCPECDRLGDYQGAGLDGDVWTGTSYTVMYCPECDLSWSLPRRSTPRTEVA